MRTVAHWEREKKKRSKEKKLRERERKKVVSVVVGASAETWSCIAAAVVVNMFSLLDVAGSVVVACMAAVVVVTDVTRELPHADSEKQEGAC